jgi:hypothetical protein
MFDFIVVLIPCLSLAEDWLLEACDTLGPRFPSIENYIVR